MADFQAIRATMIAVITQAITIFISTGAPPLFSFHCTCIQHINFILFLYLCQVHIGKFYAF